MKKLDLKKCVEIIRGILPPDMPAVVSTEFSLRLPGTMLVMLSRGNWAAPIIVEWSGHDVRDYGDVSAGAYDRVRQEQKEPRPTNPTPGLFAVDVDEMREKGCRILYRRFNGVEWDAWNGLREGAKEDACVCDVVCPIHPKTS